MKLPNWKKVGNLEYCISETLHHTCWSKFQFAPGEEAQLRGNHRINTIEDGLKRIAQRIQRIKELAERTNNSELLYLLNEQFEFGCAGKTA